ncbi:hypothetical protein LSAT2_015031 [Lamellibrachia satsuma]|nr:hypothetical protein LSAT2_015031 [Lamellibrachia satsuma]
MGQRGGGGGRRGKLQCICTTSECYRDNVATCTADHMCYVQYMPSMRDNPETIVRGCINDRTPLLCENRRPKSYDGAWPILYCCLHQWCNRDTVPTQTPVTPAPPVADDKQDGEKKVGVNAVDSTPSYRVVTDKDSNYDEAVSNYNQRTSATRSRHGRQSRRSVLINPLYIGVPIAGACVLLAMIIFAIYILRRSAPYSQRAYHYPANMARQPCPPPGGARTAVARTQIYIGCDRSPSGSEAKLLMKGSHYVVQRNRPLYTATTSPRQYVQKTLYTATTSPRPYVQKTLYTATTSPTPYVQKTYTATISLRPYVQKTLYTATTSPRPYVQKTFHEPRLLPSAMNRYNILVQNWIGERRGGLENASPRFVLFMRNKFYGTQPGHREELNIRLFGKEIKQVDGFVYLGGMVTEDGHSAAEVRRRTQAGAIAWRKARPGPQVSGPGPAHNRRPKMGKPAARKPAAR